MFRAPTFNLTFNAWRVSGAGGAYATPDLTSICNLSMGRRVLSTFSSTIALSNGIVRELLVPKLTDVRAAWNGTQHDLVEVPAGSKRFYNVTDVDDIAKGFGNEYRIALLSYITAGGSVFGFTAPVPLP